MKYKNKILYIFLLGMITQISTYAQQWKSESILSDGNWYKIAIAQSGVHKIGVAELNALKGIATKNIAIYGLNGGQLPMNNNALVNDDLIECDIEIVDKNGNGIMDDNDYILFYAEGASIWKYDQNNQFVTFEKNTYSNYNYCYLTINAIDGKRIQTKESPDGNYNNISTYTAVGVIDNDLINTNKSGQIWVGERFNSSTRNRIVNIAMPLMKVNTPMKVYMGFANLSSKNGTFDITYGNTNRTIVVNSDLKYKTMYEQYQTINSSSPEFSITYHPQENMAEGYLDFIQINADAPTRYENRAMDMWCKGNGLQQYTITNYPNDMRIWDVSDVTSIKRLALNNGIFKDNANGMRHYVAFGSNNTITPHAINKIANQNLHGHENVSMVIVTHPEFKNQAERLADLHRLMDGMLVMVVTPNEVFNEFSSGRQDPMAIRQLMRMMWERYTTNNELEKPGYLLLFGRGTYDHRNLLERNQGCVVTYQSVASFDDERKSYCSDELMGYMGKNASGKDNENHEISIGRLPASNANDAKRMVDKIERYMMRNDLVEDKKSRGDWRNFVTLLADDADPSKPGDTSFTNSSEYTAKMLQKTYPYVNIDKIYADSYIQQSGAVGSYYPDVNNALKNRINYGTLLLNYVGHGSVLYIGTERYMEIPDIEGYSNTDRLAFFVTSTCSFGRYDDPEVLSGAETFLLANNAGIGSIAASRPIGHDKAFNTRVCLNMLDPELRIGDALRDAKNKHYASQSITLFGDPALKLSTPQKEVKVTRINNKEVNPEIADTGLVLSEIMVEGEIRNRDGSLDKNFNGVIHSIVYDRTQHGYTLANDNEGCHVPFTQQKNILYKGRDTVIDGKWSYKFIVPRDVAYQFDYGRLSHYAHNGNIDAAGSYTNIVFGGFNQNADLTENRPDIALYIGDTNFINGGVTDSDPTIYAILKDKIGINAFGSGLGHDITATIDNNPNNIIILNDFYETDIYDSRKGYINYELKNLAPGWHTLTLKAWNIYNYSNSATIKFKVIDTNDEENTLGKYYAFPNPAQTETRIHIEYSSPRDVESARIDIYNMQGQLVRSFTPKINNNSYTIGPIIWNMKNQAGNIVGNGIYLARIIITTKEGSIMESIKIIKNQ